MKKSNLLILLLITILLTFGLIAGCGGGGGEEDSEGGSGGDDTSTGSLAFQVTADGNSTQSTTKLNFYFRESVTGISVSNITLSGVTDVQKGILSQESFTSDDINRGYSLGTYQGGKYTLPISGFRTSGILNVKVTISGKEGNSSVQIYYRSVADGIYLGIIKFSGDATSINLSSNYYGGDTSNSDAPILLDSNVINNFYSRLQNQYQRVTTGGSAVYYAVHKALANLKNSENSLPASPDSVYLITFTDGNDNGSSGQLAASPIENKEFGTLAEYVNYIKGEIANRKINGKEITAYSIGIQGSDVTDLPGFTTFLQNIASPGKSKVASSFSDVNSTFDEIADGLIQGSNFTMTTTLLESGTKVRMTFDITGGTLTHAQAITSTKYIEGTVTRTGSGASMAYSFTVDSYVGGISSDTAAGSIIQGTINTTNQTVEYLFRNITGYDSAARTNTKQWLMPPGQSTWQINSEYVTRRADFGNTIIYLVLDCSPSLTYSDIDSIRTYVHNFVNKIYNARYSSGY